MSPGGDLELAGREYRDAFAAYRKARAARDRAILAAHGASIGPREIGRRAGLDHAQVLRIIKKGSSAIWIATLKSAISSHREIAPE